MLRIGLTGGIGAGKSTVSARLAEAGFMIIDADVIAREVVEPGQVALRRIEERFGPRVMSGDTLDRAALAEIVFSDRAALTDLEGITHPAIEARTAELFAEAPDDAIVVHDMPLLVEKDLGEQYHLVVTVEADEPLRTARLMRDRGMTQQQVRARMAAQAGSAERSAVADVVLRNDASRDDLTAAVDRLVAERIRPLAQNLAAGRPAPTAPAVPGGAALAARRLMARLRAHLPPSAQTIDDVASAEPAVAIVVGVDSDEASADPAFISGMARAALVQARQVGEHPRFASADPGAPAVATVMAAGSQSWLAALGADRGPHS